MLRLLRWYRLGARRYRVISSCPKMVTSVTELPFRMGLEGIVSKRTDPEARACGQRDDFVQGHQYKIIIANSP
jgi:hypothetical protein